MRALCTNLLQLIRSSVLFLMGVEIVPVLLQALPAEVKS